MTRQGSNRPFILRPRKRKIHRPDQPLHPVLLANEQFNGARSNASVAGRWWDRLNESLPRVDDPLNQATFVFHRNTHTVLEIIDLAPRGIVPRELLEDHDTPIKSGEHWSRNQMDIITKDFETSKAIGKVGQSATEVSDIIEIPVHETIVPSDSLRGPNFIHEMRVKCRPREQSQESPAMQGVSEGGEEHP